MYSFFIFAVYYFTVLSGYLISSEIASYIGTGI